MSDNCGGGTLATFLCVESRSFPSKESPKPFAVRVGWGAGDLLLFSVVCGTLHASFELLETGIEGSFVGRIISPAEIDANPDLCALATATGHCPRLLKTGECP